MHELYKNSMKYFALVLLVSQQYVLPEGELVGEEVVGSFVGVLEGKFVGFTVGPENATPKNKTVFELFKTTKITTTTKITFKLS